MQHTHHALLLGLVTLPANGYTHSVVAAVALNTECSNDSVCDERASENIAQKMVKYYAEVAEHECFAVAQIWCCCASN
jgi:hypothetical protein